MTTLIVKDLVAGYGDTTILNGVSLQVKKGQIVTLIGPNGAGKSTVLKAIMGLLPPRSGSVKFESRELAGLPPETIVSAGVGFVPQVENVFPNLTVGEHFTLAAPKNRQALTDEALDFFPLLRPQLRKMASVLSGGERQILVIARALMASPKVLLLDEPSLGLAPRIVAQVMELIQRLRDESGLTVVLVEQNARGALAIADLGVVLNVGRVVVIEDAAVLAADEALRMHYLGF